MFETSSPTNANSRTVEPVENRPTSKLKSFLSRFRLSSIDLIALFAFLTAFTAFWFPVLHSGAAIRQPDVTLLNILPLSLCLIAACLAAMASLIAWGKLKSSMLFGAAGFCVFGLACYFMGIWSSSSYKEIFSFAVGLEKDKATLSPLLILGALISVYFVYWIGNLIFKKATNSAAFSKWLKPTKTHILIGIAGTLFVLAQIQNIFFPEGFTAGMKSNGSASLNITIGVCLGLFAFLMFQLVPAWLLTRKIGDGFKWCLVAATLVISLLLLFAFLSSAHRSVVTEINLLCGFTFFWCFLCMLLLLQESHVTDPSEQSAKAQPDRPTFWSVIPLLGICAVFYSAWATDLEVLIESKSWTTAVASKTLAKDTDGQIRTMPNSWGATWLAVSLNEEAQPDILNHLPTDVPYCNPRFSDLNPATDLSPLSKMGLSGVITVVDSELTSAQMELISNIATDLMLHNVTIVDPEVGFDFGFSPRVWCSGFHEGNLSSFLNAVRGGWDDLQLRLSSNHPLNETELHALVAASQHLAISIDEPIVYSMVNSGFEPKQSMRNVTIGPWTFDRCLKPTTPIDGAPQPRSREEIDRFFDFLFQNDISVEYGPLPTGLTQLENRAGIQRAWDLAFVKTDCAAPAFQRMMTAVRFEKDIAKSLESYHLVFGKDETNSITDLYLPNGGLVLNGSKETIDFCKSIEVLSLNPRWLTGNDRVARNIVPENEQIGESRFQEMPNLKHLDLGFDTEVRVANFLELIPQIEKLTINLASGIRPTMDFSVCQELKSLVFYGTPSKTTAKTLAGLPNLEKIVIIDEGDGTLNKASIKNLIRMLGKPDVNIIKKEDFVPEAPEKFKQHLRLTRERILKD